MHQLISKRTAMIILNVAMLVSFWAAGKLKADLQSIAATITTLVIMNLVAWRSGKDFPDWK
jgi:hypothetical protein